MLLVVSEPSEQQRFEREGLTGEQEMNAEYSSTRTIDKNRAARFCGYTIKYE